MEAHRHRTAFPSSVAYQRRQRRRQQRPRQGKLFAIKEIQVTRHVENQVQPEEASIRVVALRRKTTFFSFLLVICQLAIVDTHNLLPVGILCYALGIGIVLELLQSSEEHILWHELLQYEEEIRHQRELRHREEFLRQQEIFRQEEMQQVQQLVDFKFRVLQGKPYAPRVLAREENGHLIYYTI